MQSHVQPPTHLHGSWVVGYIHARRTPLRTCRERQQQHVHRDKGSACQCLLQQAHSNKATRPRTIVLNGVCLFVLKIVQQGANRCIDAIVKVSPHTCNQWCVDGVCLGPVQCHHCWYELYQ